ncbi:5'-nucleotidase domain-containing protein [Dichanthelium oligosanthes]|uniref:5'-nucleotidase domain-containing protein n=1 Tax=Dichanthelium oligosanthes TaxID=888268 RepID=A0A1E5VYH7_9POAL|nr:5'-nucleotidase domain-containing protein [Dichanthelium oligosanthes]
MGAAAAGRLHALARCGSLSPALSTTTAPRSSRGLRALCTLSTTLRSGAGEDEIERIRREFEDAKRNYLSIPAAIKDMPKMNPQGIYVNKNVKLDDLQVYGFDYDYTLSRYTEHLQCLIYDLAKKHLVNELKYPESCLQYEYDRSFPIRGLYYDKLKGCLLKLDFFGSIEPDACFFGRRKLSLSEIKELYGTRHIGRDQARQLVGLMDVFCFSEDKHFDGNSWRELFDVVIAQANKPTFYNSDHPFRVYDTQKDTLAFTAVDKFLPDQVYYHGCLKSFLQITKWRGPEVIYFGDHLLSDLRGPSKAGWRTAAVIQELEDEIEIQNSDGYRFQQAKLSIIHDLLGKVHATVVSTEKGQVYRALLDELNAERRQCRSGMRDLFNSSFGATFLTDTGRESSFAYHIHQYADIYTSKLENFLSYAPESWLHPPHDIKIMPHNAKVPASLFSTS